ncbi:MAG: hypothetical protein VW082_12890 [Candidatus Nanopelagicales bacterium]
MVRALFLAVLFAITSCVTARQVEPTTVAIQNADSAWRDALRAVVDAGFTVATKDREAGIIQTEWRDIRDANSRATTAALIGNVRREIRFIISIDGTRATVRPETQVCTPQGGCTQGNHLTPQDEALASRIIGRIGAAPQATQPVEEMPDD